MRILIPQQSLLRKPCKVSDDGWPRDLLQLCDTFFATLVRLALDDHPRYFILMLACLIAQPCAFLSVDPNKPSISSIFGPQFLLDLWR